MSQEFENFSFVTKINPDDHIFLFLVDSTKIKYDSPSIKSSNQSNLHSNQKNSQSITYHPNSPIDEIKTKPSYSLGIDFSPKLEERFQSRPQRGSPSKSQGIENETLITFGDESGMESLATDRQRLVSDANRNEAYGVSFLGTRYRSNPETLESPRKAPQSARDHDRKKRSYVRIPDEAQIQKFKSLLSQHPEPRPITQLPSSNRIPRPKSQQPMINSFMIDSKLNFHWKPVLGRKKGRDSSNDSFEKASNSGFLSDRRALPRRPDQSVLPTKPIMIYRKRVSKNREQMHNIDNISSENKEKRLNLAPQQDTRDKINTQFKIKANTIKRNGAITDRTRSQENHFERLPLERVLLDNEKSPYRILNRHYIRLKKSNLPISQKTRKLVKTIEKDSLIEKSLTEATPNKNFNNFPYMNFVFDSTLSQINEPIQKVSVDPIKASREAKPPNNDSFRARFRTRVGQKSGFKQTFGVLDSLEADLAYLNKNNPTRNSGKENENKHIEHKTPKFKADNSSIFQKASKLTQSNASRHIESQILTEMSENGNSSDQFVYESPIPYFGGNRIKPPRVQTHLSSYSITKNPM